MNEYQKPYPRDVTSPGPYQQRSVTEEWAMRYPPRGHPDRWLWDATGEMPTKLLEK